MIAADADVLLHVLKALEPNPNRTRLDAELRERLRRERNDEPRGRSWSEQMEDECGYHGDRK